MVDGRTALILGGTGFVGIHLVDRLIREGWQVTLFNRGVTGLDLFGSLVRLRGDRDIDASALAEGSWDVVYDLSGFHPEQVSRTGQHLAGSCGHYVFVSTISVYDGFSETGATEGAPLATLDGPIPDQPDMAVYGPLKVLCEQRVSELFDSVTIVRPAIIVGPGDTSDRFTYWVSRISTPGPHVVPPASDARVQFIDVRDLAAWLVQLGDTRTRGIFNAAGPPLRFDALLDTIAEVSVTPLHTVGLTDEQMIAEDVRAWIDLPLWLPPEDRAMRGFFDVDSARAVEAGLINRPVGETVCDTLTWARDRNVDELRVGLSVEREAELVARYTYGD